MPGIPDLCRHCPVERGSLAWGSTLPPFLSSLVRFYFDLSFLSLFPTLPPRRGELFLSETPSLIVAYVARLRKGLPLRRQLPHSLWQSPTSPPVATLWTLASLRFPGDDSVKTASRQGGSVGARPPLLQPSSISCGGLVIMRFVCRVRSCAR